MTLTFAGLIRAHGDGGTGGTTIDPENTYVTTNSGATTTFDLEGTYYTTIGHSTTFDIEATYQTTTYDNTTTWDQEETIVTEITTSKPKEPALYKDVPEGTELIELQSTSANEGVVSVTEEKDPKNDDELAPKFSGKIRWSLSYKMKISAGEKVQNQNNSTWILKQKECLSCLVSDIKLTIVVIHIDGANGGHQNAIRRAIHKTLDELFNDPSKCNDGIIFGNDCNIGVSVTAIDEQGVGKVDVVDSTPDPVVSAASKPVIIQLDADVDPGIIAAPQQTVEFSAFLKELKDFNQENFNVSVKQAIEQAVIEHIPQHRATVLTIPTLAGVVGKGQENALVRKRKQKAIAGMTTNPVHPGAHCNL
jgi:hypothetical protein